MEYRNLGRTGLKVSRLLFGGAHIGEIIGQEETTALVREAWDVGINTFYMSDKYNNGLGETLLGNAIASRREEMVLVIKVGYRVGSDRAPVTDLERLATHGEIGEVDHDALWKQGVTPSSRGLSRKHILQAVEGSLRRLKTDYIDVYEAHFWDRDTPVEETLAAFDDLIRQGKVRYIGCSQTKAWQLYRALWVSELKGLPRYQSWQVLLNLIDRERRQDQLDAAEAEGIGVFAFQSLAGGLLSGKFSPDSVIPEGLGHRRVYLDAYWNDANFALVDGLKDVALRFGRESAAELAQAWALGQRAVAALQVGPTIPADFASSVKAATNPLTSEEANEISILLRESPGSPSGPMAFPDPGRPIVDTAHS